MMVMSAFCLLLLRVVFLGDHVEAFGAFGNFAKDAVAHKLFLLVLIMSFTKITLCCYHNSASSLTRILNCIKGLLSRVRDLAVSQDTLIISITHAAPGHVLILTYSFGVVVLAGAPH